MQMKIKCPNPDCGKVLVVTSEMAGKKAKCSHCDTAFKIPEAVAKGGDSGSKSSVKQPKPKPKSESGSAFRQATGGSKSGSKRKPKAGAGRGTPPAKKRPQKSEVDDFSVDDDYYEDDEYYEDDDYYEDDYDDEPRRGQRGRGNGGRSRVAGGRGRAHRDEYDDYEDDYYEDDYYEDDYYDEDEYDAPPRRSKRSGGGGGNPKKQWAKVRLGFLLLAIGMSVFAGTHVLRAISDLLSQLASASMTSAFEDANASRSTPRRTTMRELQQEAEARRNKMETAQSMGKAAGVVMKIGQTIAFFGLIACVVGYVFCVMGPNKNGMLGLAIAVLSVGSINLILRLIFKLIPVLGGDSFFYDRSILSGSGIMLMLSNLSRAFGAAFGGSSSLTGKLVFALIMDLALFAEFILLALFMAAVAKSMKDRGQRRDSMKVVYMAAAAASVMLLMYIFGMIDWEAGSSWPVYLIRTLGWIGNILMGLMLFFLIQNLFYAKSASG